MWTFRSATPRSTSATSAGPPDRSAAPITSGSSRREPGWVLSHDQILSHVWGSDYAGDRNQVKLHVWYLRQKIETTGTCDRRSKRPGQAGDDPDETRSRLLFRRLERVAGYNAAMPTVLGVDGCPHGWCAVQFDTDTRALTSSHHDTFRNVLSTFPRITIAIDVPIGLMQSPGGRDCDRSAREYLGWPRRNSVFSPPVRQALSLTGHKCMYKDACRVNREATGGTAISQQSFWIGPKIREVDNRMTRTLERRVYEAHPEVSFAAMNSSQIRTNVGAQRLRATPTSRRESAAPANAPQRDPRHAMRYRKGTPAGRAERWRVLRRTFSDLPRTPVLPHELRRLCDLEDYIDALACAWTAACIKAGDASPLPARPPRDPEGLRMAIWRPNG